MADVGARRVVPIAKAERRCAIPPEVRREGVRGLLNFVGCALGGARDEAINIAIKMLAPFFGPPQAIVIGRAARPDALNAAFLNAVSANVLEYDDTHLGTVMHPAAPVAAGLFALAELRPVSGRELLHAFIVGVETSCRVGLAVMPTHYRRGWHITADLRNFRGGGRLRPPDRARRAPDGLGARPRRDAIRQPRRKSWQHVQEPWRRECGQERTGRGAAGRGRVQWTR
jgi:hypothetical protein